MRQFFLAAILALPAMAADGVVIGNAQSPPQWALLERELLRANSAACDRFAKKYLDSRGYLLHTPRWGTLDGPDDAIETFYNWTLLYAMGADESVLRHYKRALEGHLQQYKELRTSKTKLAENGAYYKEFITQSDWFHTGEGIRAFMFLGFADPDDKRLIDRMTRFAGLYMNEDPEAQNYDPVKKVIKSIWTGSKGPMLHKATTYDWVGDPVPGSFHLLHGKQGRGGLVNLDSVYEKMLAHCAEYIDSVGDHPLNLGTTGLALNAYALTGDKKYKDWIADYVGAWRDRTKSTGGNIPTNIGLDGTPGGEYGGRWYKGTYGWNFTIYDGEIDQTVSRNTVFSGSWPGFANAYIATGDAGFVDVLRKQLDNVHAQKKTVDGKVMVPQMYGDPRGYKQTGREEWYEWGPNLHGDRATDVYAWSGDRRDLDKVPVTGWIAYLEGKDPGYPEKAFRADLKHVADNVRESDADNTTPDTRLADYLMGFNPAAHNALANLTLGTHLTGNVWSLHARVRYFDPQRQRPGLPEDVAALVEKMSGDAVTLSLVNVNQAEARTVIVQSGAYAEHSIESASIDGRSLAVNGPLLTVRLLAGSGGRLQLKLRRHVNQPTLALPWQRPWRVASR